MEGMRRVLRTNGELYVIIDDDTLKQLLRINDELFKLCKSLNERREIETSSRLISLKLH